MANLTNLNLDHTGVSKSCIKYLKGKLNRYICRDVWQEELTHLIVDIDLEHLNPVRLQGIEKEEDNTMDME